LRLKLDLSLSCRNSNYNIARRPADHSRKRNNANPHDIAHELDSNAL
jgi:hypothetical protein